MANRVFNMLSGCETLMTPVLCDKKMLYSSELDPPGFGPLPFIRQGHLTCKPSTIQCCPSVSAWSFHGTLQGHDDEATPLL